MTRLLSFPNPKRPKEFYLRRARKHREADDFVRCLTWDGHRGCGVGCLLHKYDHALFPVEFGAPVAMGHLVDFLFENMPEGHKDFPVRFVEAIPEHADLSGVMAQFYVRMLDRRLADLDASPESPVQEGVRAAVTTVRNLHAERAEEDDLCWPAARAATRAAARAAAQSASRSAAESASWSAWAAAWLTACSPAAESAAYSAASAAQAGFAASALTAAADSAWDKEIALQAADLLELLADAPVFAEGSA